MNLSEYKREIELIVNQNNVEQELYSLIAGIMRERKGIKHISLRDVSNRRRPRVKNGKRPISKDGSYMYYGIGGYPDFVMLSEKCQIDNEGRFSKKNILGAIEAKYVGCNLINIDNSIYRDNTQIKGHILWFNKVLYTNGLEWRYYNYSPDEKLKKDIEILKENIYNFSGDKEYDWSCKEKKLLSVLDGIEPTKRFKLGKFEKNKVKWESDCCTVWGKLLNYLDTIIG